MGKTKRHRSDYASEQWLWWKELHLVACREGRWISRGIFEYVHSQSETKSTTPLRAVQRNIAERRAVPALSTPNCFDTVTLTNKNAGQLVRSLTTVCITATG